MRLDTEGIPHFFSVPEETGKNGASAERSHPSHGLFSRSVKEGKTPAGKNREVNARERRKTGWLFP